jgi:hypothetical protein
MCSELSLPLAFLRGLGLSCILLVLGLVEDDLRRASRPAHLLLTAMTGSVPLLGVIAFGCARAWAGAKGPVHRLTSRACGMAFGHLVPAVVASHALYFHWADPVAAAVRTGLKTLIAWVLRRNKVL